jgi:glyoxylase-like metal-dependent hydrolase (beta-lactamase superfamily II)
MILRITLAPIIRKLMRFSIVDFKLSPLRKYSAARRATATMAWFLTFVSMYRIEAQQDFSKVEIKVTKVAGSVYMLEGSGGNIGVSVGDDGVVIVDDQFAPLAPKIKAALKGITDKPLRFVLNTHFHGDHTGGNAQFGSEATIIAHENVRKRLQEGTTVGGNSSSPTPKEALPVITFNDRATVHLNGEDIRAIHFPNGHTDGDSVIFFPKSNVVHMGDDFVTYGFPFVDVHSGGSVGGMIAGVEKVLTLVPEDVKIIPGHGPISSPSDVRKFVEMLKDTRRLVAKAMADGKTAEQMKSDHILAQYEDLGKGFIKTDAWIDLLLTEIQNKPNAAPAYQAHGHADEKGQ